MLSLILDYNRLKGKGKNGGNQEMVGRKGTS